MFLPTLVSLFFISSATVRASPCVAFDANWNLLAFNLNGKDWNAGTQDTWSSSTAATDITASNRPPFDAANTTCYLSQYANAIYAINADSKNPSSLYIYDAAAKSWSMQAVNAGSFDYTSFGAILDHDTNVFYALSQGNLFSLDMGLLNAANSTPLSWTNDEQVPYPSDYVPVMALAQNHIHFLDVPNVPAGSADIFVIHYSYFQPQSQAYPLPDGSAFPTTYGHVASFFQADNTVQQEFAFIPADSSATYVVNVETNTTQALAAPTTKDSKATYFAGVTALVQLTSNGTVSYLPYLEGNTSTNIAATWATVSNLAAAAPPSSSSSSSSSGSSGNTSGSHSTTGPSATASGAALGASVQYSVFITCVLCFAAFVV
ncbi:uncharacterized protein HD556DRAFT_1432210 [Suillus plorans]|uniref:Uncharacterized protein n=1 Tax=Suillus plorans TaxID=116603 RepID=A0A9P7APC0_9AGAM|nr:uncharacterized protein HD556DRAFT_1432210 [Suillus plorans]KAG1793687.1 hypothetical protein HD556DRAFT_1432210 [Suillus plorans]